ncbi:2-hydroxychromene-2-carboxylate isomerase [Caulobacter sp. SLTY]|uniref:2-hydroxychromene-2-carboxylate isomerase n=1 Tax=Caulobacter sp. SLTY TaxID=2683262 RepID=UPI001411C6A9|nr:2-hydroxychromene-2-carboxylate isomerase [Caulobacter sp. SLTY]NBB14336.1 2-hydroxychromene-2-carboxylate isomerase [Caulobacter sp. SLTY]
MTKRLDFIFDFASPNAYMASMVIPGILERTGATLNVIPCLLGGLFKATGNQAPFTAFGGIKGKMDYEMLESRRFVAKHGLTKFRMNPHFPINTLIVMRAFVAAGLEGVGERYMEVVLKAMWEDGKNMGDAEVVAAVLTEAGLDAATLLERAQSHEVKSILMNNTQAAADRGAFGIPTFFVGDEIFFGKERLGQVEEELAR